MLEYKPWECTIQSRKSLVQAEGPEDQLIHAGSSTVNTLHLQQSTDHTQSQRSGGCINIFPLLCCSLSNLHQKGGNKTWCSLLSTTCELVSQTLANICIIIIVIETNIPLNVWTLPHWPRVLLLHSQILSFHQTALETSPEPDRCPRDSASDLHTLHTHRILIRKISSGLTTYCISPHSHTTMLTLALCVFDY